MKICVIHSSLKSFGGSERVALETLLVLKQMRYKVFFITTEYTDWCRITRLYGDEIRPSREIVLKQQIHFFKLYHKLFNSLFKIPRLRKYCDLIINTKGDIYSINSDITYIHYPTFILEIFRKSQNLLKKIYYLPYLKVFKKIISNKNSFGLVLTNSNFTKKIVEKLLNRNSIVIYPPVNIEAFYFPKWSNRDDAVISLGRFSPEKNYEFILHLARKLPHIKFKIVGTINNLKDYRYYKKIKNMVTKFNLKNLKIEVNVSFTKLVDLLRSGKVYLHTMRNEHFGISIVEAMASGLIPVVHKSGGPWFDIIQQGKFGYGYNDLNGAISGIIKALNVGDDFRRKIVQRSLVFDRNRFRRKMIKIINEYLEKRLKYYTR